MKYLIVEGMLDCTGIYDWADESYVEPEEIGLSAELSLRLANWLKEYEDEHYRGYVNGTRIQKLDQEGKEIAIAIRQEIADVKIAYYSDGSMIKWELMISPDDGSLFWLQVN